MRPLGDTVVLMPPVAISKADLRRLVAIVAESIRAASEGVYGLLEPQPLRPAEDPRAEIRRAA